jgi:hypothetical protein
VDGKTVITLSPEELARSGIESTMLTPAPFQEQARAYGMVLDPARLTDLANSYVAAKSQLRTAEAKLAASKPAFERARSLYQDGHAVSQAQFQAAEASFRSDDAAVASAQVRLRTLSATARQEWGSILGQSLIDGSRQVDRLIERQDFLLQVTLPPGVSIPQPPATASIEVGKDARVPITYVSPATRTDPRVQGVSFFYVASADSGVLPGMNVLAFLPTGTPLEGVVVPAAAIVWWQGRAWAYRRSDAGTFTRIEISTDLPAPGGGYFVKDLMGAAIVAAGAQLLLSEEFRAQVQVGGD